jgi:hypothetical protein
MKLIKFITTLIFALSLPFGYIEATSYIGAPIYLSQSSTSINVGQTVTVNVYGGTGNYYISSNSNSTVVSAGTSGGILQVQGLSQGTASITVCSQTSTSPCAVFTVNVYGNSWGSQTLSLSQSSLNLYPGQSTSVYIYGHSGNVSGNYYLSNNPNPSIATASINANTISVTAHQMGSLTFNVCSSTASFSCTSLYVQVNSQYGNSGSWYNQYGHGFYQTNQSGYPYGYNPYTYYPTQTQTSYYQPQTYTSQVYGQPVSGIYLNQIPATGISFGLKMVLVTLSIFIWSFFGTYIIYRFGYLLNPFKVKSNR